MKIIQGKISYDYTYEIYWGVAQPDGSVWPLHRGDGPAAIGYRLADDAVLYNIWVKNGKRHRLDGPAYQHWCNGLTASYISLMPDIEEYWINDVQYTKEEFESYIKDMNKEQIEVLADLGQTFD